MYAPGKNLLGVCGIDMLRKQQIYPEANVPGVSFSAPYFTAVDPPSVSIRLGLSIKAEARLM